MKAKDIDANKLVYAKNDIQYKVDNLVEFALCLSSEIENDYKIDDMDPLDFLKSCSNIYEDLSLYVEDIISNEILSSLSKITEESIEEFKLQKKNPSQDIRPTSGLCGQDCRLL